MKGRLLICRTISIPVMGTGPTVPSGPSERVCGQLTDKLYESRTH